MNLKKIRDLAIAHSRYNYLSDIKKNIDYNIWVDYINNNSEIFVWAENTEEGKQNLANIDNIPESFRKRVLMAHNKQRCFFDFDDKKKSYNVTISYYGEKIGIDFERIPKVEDLKTYLAMAKSLDALLLKDGAEIIDEKIIEGLEQK